MSLQAVTDDAAGADEHQAVDQFEGARGSQGAVEAGRQRGLGIGEVPGDGVFVTRSAGDHGIQGGAPGVHSVGD
ncbi:hypothetical protein B382_04480 [Stutzerimonas stutzeri B1SMN1]|nr:hypothetical protein B382_04480 [Stutzerimonas stutzeri B1SMN1]